MSTNFPEGPIVVPGTERQLPPALEKPLFVGDAGLRVERVSHPVHLGKDMGGTMILVESTGNIQRPATKAPATPSEIHAA